MIALKKQRPEAGLDLCTDVESPIVGAREVLIKVTHVGICGTDRHIYEWDTWSSNRVPLGKKSTFTCRAS